MRKSNFIVLLVAVVMGGTAAFMARNWMAAQATVAPEPSGTIVVAAANLTFGASLTSDNLRELPWPSGRLPDGAFATKEEILKDGKRAILAPVARDEAILKTKITGPGQRASLSALLEDGQRAVTVRVDDVRGVAGFVLPGDRVDVLLIRTVNRQSGPPENFSDVLLQHVKVLAVDQITNERQETPTVAKAVTLAVSTDQAQKVLLATNVGKLSLILRQAGESNPALARRITENDLGLVEIQPLAVAPAAPSVPTPPTEVRSNAATVEVVRGMKSEKYSVTRSN